MISFLLAQTIALTPRNNSIADQTGLVFQNAVQLEAGPFNQGSLLQQRVTRQTTIQEQGTEYVNHCGEDEMPIGIPGIVYGGSDSVSTIDVLPYPFGRAEVKSWFRSSKTPPAEGLRVMIQNPSVNNSPDQIPYTDRAYDRGMRSQEFIAALGTEHRLKYLAVKSGENHMTYQIKRGNQIVESGEFVVNIGIDYQDITDITKKSRYQVTLPCQPKRRQH
jgi:hypothetical protein